MAEDWNVVNQSVQILSAILPVVETVDDLDNPVGLRMPDEDICSFALNLLEVPLTKHDCSWGRTGLQL